LYQGFHGDCLSTFSCVLKQTLLNVSSSKAPSLFLMHSDTLTLCFLLGPSLCCQGQAGTYKFESKNRIDMKPRPWRPKGPPDIQRNMPCSNKRNEFKHCGRPKGPPNRQMNAFLIEMTRGIRFVFESMCECALCLEHAGLPKMHLFYVLKWKRTK